MFPKSLVRRGKVSLKDNGNLRMKCLRIPKLLGYTEF